MSLYIRLFAIVRWLRITSYIALVVTFMFYWASMPLAGIFCFPRAGEFWDGNLLLRCQRLAIVGPVQGVVGLAADIFILVLPLPVVYKLNLAPRRKIGLAAVFLAGVLYVSLGSARRLNADLETAPSLPVLYHYTTEFTFTEGKTLSGLLRIYGHACKWDTNP